MDNNLVPAQDNEDTYKQGCNRYDNTASNRNVQEAWLHAVYVSNATKEHLSPMFGGKQALLSPRSESSSCAVY